MSQTVVIAGAAGPLGRRVAALAAADDAVTRVVAIGPGVSPFEMPPSIEARPIGLDDPEVKALLAEAGRARTTGPTACRRPARPPPTWPPPVPCSTRPPPWVCAR